jgi:hypothetical protein
LGVIDGDRHRHRARAGVETRLTEEQHLAEAVSEEMLLEESVA